MHLLWKRYSRSGAAPPWFYVLMAMAFVALGIWAGAQGNWLVMVLAVAMIGVTAGGARMLRSLRDGAAAPREPSDTRKDGDDG